jgi:hypothetical protein
MEGPTLTKPESLLLVSRMAYEPSAFTQHLNSPFTATTTDDTERHVQT